MSPDTHKEFVDRQKALADEAGKAVARKVLSQMNLQEILSNGKAARKRFLAGVIKESDKHFTVTLDLGREFLKVKTGGQED